MINGVALHNSIANPPCLAFCANDRTLTNYVVFAAVTSMLRYLPESYQAPQRRLAEVLMGVSEQPPHWRTCVSRTVDTLGFAVSALYVDEYYSESDRQQVS